MGIDKERLEQRYLELENSHPEKQDKFAQETACRIGKRTRYSNSEALKSVKMALAGFAYANVEQKDAEYEKLKDAADIYVQTTEYPPMPVVPLSKWKNVSIPEHVLWHTTEGKQNTFLPVGDVALLSAAGGTGKSWVALSIACAACTGRAKAVGLHVRSGPVIYVSYEDSIDRIAHRIHIIKPKKTRDLWKNLGVIDSPAPLYTVSRYGKAQPTQQWDALWTAAEKIKPSLIIIDPASASIDGAQAFDGAAIRTYLTALRKQAKQMECGVLIVTHDTKATRDHTFAGNLPGAGAVAGSATWYDASRGVLYMMQGTGDDASRRLMICTKSNYGPNGWGIELEEAMTQGQFAGFEFVKKYTREAIADRSAKICSKSSKSPSKTKKSSKKTEYQPDSRLVDVPPKWRAYGIVKDEFLEDPK